MSHFASELRDKPVIERCATVGLLLGLAIGAVGGLIRGLEVHPATAWFAMFEVGIPAAIVGALLGVICGGAVTFWRWVSRHINAGA